MSPFVISFLRESAGFLTNEVDAFFAPVCCMKLHFYTNNYDSLYVALGHMPRLFLFDIFAKVVEVEIWVCVEMSFQHKDDVGR